MQALKQAITLSKTPPTVEDEAALAKQHAAAKAKLDTLFGIESDARNVVDKHVNDLAARAKIAAKIKTHANKYLPFAIESLKWRTADGLPKLVVFSLQDPIFSIEFNPHRGASIRPQLPAPVQNAYRDVIELLRKKVADQLSSGGTVGFDRGGGEISWWVSNDRQQAARDTLMRQSMMRAFYISAKFSGVIPDSTRTKIIEAIDVFQEIFIVAEPVDMKIESKLVPAPLPADPIVVGWDGEDLWYIDDFDTTPVEEASLLVPQHNKR